MSEEPKLVAPEGFTMIQEGKASVLVPLGNKVFYNNVQEFNRDMSTMVLTQFHETLKEESQDRIDRWIEQKKKGPAGTKKAKKNNGEALPIIATESVEDIDTTTLVIPDRLQYNGLRIFEALSASGLRSIRFFKEIPGVESIVVNDLDPSAVAAIRRNVEFNGISTDKVIPNHGDATVMMYLNRPNPPEVKTASQDPSILNAPSIFKIERPSNLKPWNAIDLDPYGSAAPFLDAAVQAIETGGILNVTCTDLAVLCGNHAETCFAKYGAMSLSSHACHEMALRIVLGLIDTIAARYGRYIEPLLSFSIDFYLRVFVRVRDSPLNAKFAGTKRAVVYNCVGCRSFDIQKLGKCSNDSLPEDKKLPIDRNKFTPATGPPVNKYCPHCGSLYKVGGPVWAGPIHDRSFAERCYKYVKDNNSKFRTHARMAGMLHQAMTELKDSPFYFAPSLISNILHCSTISSQYIHSAIYNAGFEFSETHCSAGSIKTNAPFAFVLDIFKAYIASLPTDKLPSTMSLTREKFVGSQVTLDPSMLHADVPTNDKNQLLFDRRSTDDVTTAVAVDAAVTTEDDGINLTETVSRRGAKSPGYVILSRPITHDIDFTLRSMSDMKKKRVAVFFPNPEQFWGPKAAAGIFSNDNKHGLTGEQAAQLDTDNIARANAIAQHQKAVENQGKNKRTRDVADVAVPKEDELSKE